MSTPVELVPMFCPHCQNAILAQPEEVAWVCSQCGQGLLLDDEHGLEPLQVHFSASIPINATGKPFWVATGQVSIQRTTYRGDQTNEMLAFWQSPRRFFIPAFELPLEDGLALGNRLLQQPPPLQEGKPVKFVPVTVPPTDMRPLGEFTILSVEAGRKDDLKTLDFNLKLDDPQLWILA